MSTAEEPPTIKGPSGPVDGYSIDREGDKVILIFSNRYGEQDKYTLDLDDARFIGLGLLFRGISEE